MAAFMKKRLKSSATLFIIGKLIPAGPPRGKQKLFASAQILDGVLHRMFEVFAVCTRPTGLMLEFFSHFTDGVGVDAV